MYRKEILLRLTSRLIARRDGLRIALNCDLGSLREISAMSGVGDNVDAAVDSAIDATIPNNSVRGRFLGELVIAQDEPHFPDNKATVLKAN